MDDYEDDDVQVPPYRRGRSLFFFYPRTKKNGERNIKKSNLSPDSRASYVVILTDSKKKVKVVIFSSFRIVSILGEIIYLM